MNNLETYLKEGLEDISASEFYYILNKLFSVNKLDIITDKYKDKIDQVILNKVIERRLNNEPLQYIFNESYFRNYIFFVDKRVLIPRPETELLVDKVIELVKENNLNEPKIVDIGTGSGAIAISLAIEIKDSEVYSVDISKEALEVATINKAKYLITDKKLQLIHGDKLEVFNNNKIKFDILVSNPPYIKYDDYVNLDKNVLDYEPKIALLDNDKDGTGFYQYFAQNSHKYLNKNGIVCFEIAYSQALIVTDILKENNFKEISVMKDYSNNDRIVSARL